LALAAVPALRRRNVSAHGSQSLPNGGTQATIAALSTPLERIAVRWAIASAHRLVEGLAGVHP
jgi:hypothetical protein